MSDNTISMELRDEEYLIGGIIVKPETIYTAQEHVSSTDFISDGFADVFFAVQMLLKKGVPLNTSTIAIELDRIKALDKIGGVTRFSQLLRDGQPHNVLYYSEQVAIASQRRRLRQTIAKIMDRTTGAFDPVEIAGELSAASTLIDKASKEQKSIGAVLGEFLEQCELDRQAGHVAVMPTGLRSLDDVLLGGLPNGYITIGARPSIGKSAVGAEIALRPARDRNVPTLFISLEMSFRQFALRFMLRGTSLTSMDLNRLTYTDAQLQEMIRVASDHQQCPMDFWHKPGASIASIEARIRADIAKRGCKLVVIDYLQLIKAPKGIYDKRLQTSHVSNEIARISKSLNIPLVVLAQAGRGAEGASPELNHLKESGSIEEDSDIVILLNRDDRSAETLQVKVAKFRDGSIAGCELAMRRGAVYSSDERNGAYNDF
jgi:replicative DNA helicase